MSRRIPTMLFAFAVASASLGAATAASSGKYRVDDSEESRVQFVSDAPLEKITGVGHKLSGNVQVDPADLSKTSGKIELDVNSIKTGLDLRDEHLRSDSWLDAKKYPKIGFDITKVEGAKSLKPGETAQVTVRGKLSMHGVTREESAKATVRMTDAGIKVKANFKVNLQQYKVSVPAVVRLKVNDDIELNVMLLVKQG